MFPKKKTAKSMPMTVRTEMNPRKKMKLNQEAGSADIMVLYDVKGLPIHTGCSRAALRECTRQRLKRAVVPENTTSDGMCAVVEQYITNEVVILDVAGPNLTFLSRRCAAVKQYSPDRAAVPRVVGPEPTIPRSACAVLVQYGSSQLAVPGVAGAKFSMPSLTSAVVVPDAADQVTLTGVAGTHPTISISTCAVMERLRKNHLASPFIK